MNQCQTSSVDRFICSTVAYFDSNLQPILSKQLHPASNPLLLCRICYYAQRVSLWYYIGYIDDGIRTQTLQQIRSVRNRLFLYWIRRGDPPQKVEDQPHHLLHQVSARHSPICQRISFALGSLAVALKLLLPDLLSDILPRGNLSLRRSISHQQRLRQHRTQFIS